MSFEADVMDDLFYDEAEGPARHFDEYDEYDAYEGSDEFLRSIIGGVGRVVGGLMGGGGEGFDEYDEWDAYESDEYEGDAIDAMEEAVVDALDAEDTDEFFRRLARGIGRVARGAVRVARRVAPVVGRIARTVAPIASAIPLPWTQAIGRVAGVMGRLMADEADEFEALDEMFDLAEVDDIDAAAPVIAGLTIRTAMPGVARLPRAQRRQLVRSATQAVRTVARRQGPQAARALPAVVGAVQRGVRQRRIPPRAVPQAIRRTATRVAQSPRLVRRAVRAGAVAGAATARRPVPSSAALCAACRRRQRLAVRGPARA
ncbi:hypothetical protein [Methylococcus sp. EFPC2]|uniref:hypothetical protein n=1 Tax=Methylococcus sp. EFPC2 TaxID=2812648 RepID=UPI001968235F|nr:hypothetical protein [Methylococcus sp. EFPC2]QSA97003.1 hypothetical protein JWZ97_17655 [Methylococcus sp. EFPC2]